ncbi:hypothetical protein [Deinococcus maricopensis]|uniref:Uncharacterized protein n=1 Tax=Deinococcus maricopensis (strain DSM 21211 / LMG 22137 / NRRL B-23946 / LB-34) TaxID=709986 RepID=E8UA89_DEIML|nr:hypothetical protein [Deinococcus maricopensis]ADV67978.1 conserved hypothetical protein, precursor [Deinococcus maricopensis DSM 21211]
MAGFQRIFLSLIGGASTALIAYGVAFSRGWPMGMVEVNGVRKYGFKLHGDADLAARLIPLELLIGLLVAWLIWRAFTRRAATTPRADAEERMVYRYAMRKGGRFTLRDLEVGSPLGAGARAAVQRLEAQGRVVRDGDDYRLA